MPYEGVQYDLKIEKSLMHLQVMTFGLIGAGQVAANTNDIIQKVTLIIFHWLSLVHVALKSDKDKKPGTLCIYTNLYTQTCVYNHQTWNVQGLNFKDWSVTNATTCLDKLTSFMLNKHGKTFAFHMVVIHYLPSFFLFTCLKIGNIHYIVESY